MLSENIYYVYFLIDPRNDLPFYIGKGKGDRVCQHYYEWNSNDKYNPFKTRKIQLLKKLGYDPVWVKIAENLTEDEAYDTEQVLIMSWGRTRFEENGILTNIAPGGRQGPSNSKPVDCYNEYGEFVKTYPSARVAGNELGLYPCSISQCCRKTSTHKQVGGFFWSHTGTPLDLDWCWEKKHPVYIWTLQGEYVNRFPNASDAINTLGLHSTRTSIYSCLSKGEKYAYRCNRAAGYIWTYTNQPPQPYVSNAKRVRCVTTGEVFETLALAAAHFNVLRSSIIKVCKGHRKSTKNLVFEYA